jgi:streptogramin lyase
VVASAADLEAWKRRIVEEGGGKEPEAPEQPRRRWGLGLAAGVALAAVAATGLWVVGENRSGPPPGGAGGAEVQPAVGGGGGCERDRKSGDPGGGRWRAEISDGSWLTVKPAEGMGDATFEYAWSANTGNAGRMAAIRVNGTRFTVVQVSEGGEYTPWGKVGSGNIVTIAGTGVWGYNGDGLPAAKAQLKNPVGITVDDNGNVYVADLGNNRIRRVGARDHVITSVAGVGVNGFGGDGGPAAAALLDGPYHLALDPDGNLLFGDAANRRVRKVELATGRIITVAGGGQEVAGNGQEALAAKLACPVTGVAADRSGGIVYTEFYTGGVWRVDRSGRLRELAFTRTPNDVAVDAAGNVYVTAEDAHVIQMIDGVTGRLSRVAGTGLRGSRGDGGPAIAADLCAPRGIAVDEAGNVFFANRGEGMHFIRRIEAGSGRIKTIAGNGLNVYGGDGGPAREAGISTSRVAVDGAGNVYVTDYDNNRVRFIGFMTGRKRVPRSPSDVVVERVAGRKAGAHVRWKDESDDEDGFEQKTKAGMAEMLDDDSPDGVCGYSMAAFNEGGTSGYAKGWIGGDPEAIITVPMTAVNVNAEGREGGITIRRTDAAVNESEYLLKRYMRKGSECVEDQGFGIVKLAANTQSYTDRTARRDTCGYEVATRNAAGTSIWIGDKDLGAGMEQFR